MQNNVSFRGCIPVEFYARYPKTNKYVPIVKPRNVKKCQSFVVRNLNKTLKEENRTTEFVEIYKSVDKDYARTPSVRSYFDKYVPVAQKMSDPYFPSVYLFTGNDIDKANEIGRNLGEIKSDIFERTGQKDNAEVERAKRHYHNQMKKLFDKICSRVRDEQGNDLTLRVFFEPKYKKNGEFKKFEYKHATFYPVEY